MKVVWKRVARRDLHRIHEALAMLNRRAADRWMDTLEQRVSILVTYPRIGRVVPEHGDIELRELIFGDHRIWYRIVGDRIRIVAIWDSRRGSLPDTIAERPAIYA